MSEYLRSAGVPHFKSAAFRKTMNPNIDWTQCPNDANGWQVVAEGTASWVKVTTEYTSYQLVRERFGRLVESGRSTEPVAQAPLFGWAGAPDDSFTPMPPWGRAPPEEYISGLSYESLRALRIMRDRPDQEGSKIAAEADCGWQELFDMAQRGLIDAGMERLEPKTMHPSITAKGRAVVAAAEHIGVLTGEPSTTS